MFKKMGNKSWVGSSMGGALVEGGGSKKRHLKTISVQDGGGDGRGGKRGIFVELR